MAGRVALVTGSTSGIGRGIASAYAREGAHVVVTGRREALGRQVAEAIGGAFIRADLTDVDQATRLVAQTVERYGALDTLVNNAGDPGSARDADGPIHTTDVEFWDAMYASSVRSAFAVTKAAIPHLRACGRGRVIHVSSVQAITGWGWDAYSAAKAALVGLTRSMAVAYARDAITVNCLAVGTVVVERTAEYWDTDEGKRLWDRVGLTRIGVPEDIAHACVYLGSDEAAYVTGAVLSVDGGMAVRGTPGLRR